MKKTFYALFAVLLVLSLATCGDEPATGGQVTSEGMATLTINVDNSGGAGKALTVSNAGAEAGYYEVIFKFGASPKYYQVAWAKPATSSPSITIPAGNYANGTNDAILFAGNNSTDKILLGVGTISSTTGGANSGPNAEIHYDTTGVVFTVTALRNGVSNNRASSTFKITGPTSDDVNSWDYSTATTNNSPPIALSGSIPIFPIPGYDSVATSAYPAPGTATDPITATYSFTNIPHNTAVILQAACTASAATLGTWPSPATTGAVSYGTVTGGTVGSALSATQTFTIPINVSAVTVNGLAAFTIDAPVRAFTNAAIAFETGSSPGSAIIWHIKGGTDDTEADDGSGNGSAVVLAVGTRFNVSDASLTIPNPTTPFN